MFPVIELLRGEPGFEIGIFCLCVPGTTQNGPGDGPYFSWPQRTGLEPRMGVYRRPERGPE